jgi:hypothetical protein
MLLREITVYCANNHENTLNAKHTYNSGSESYNRW